MDRELMELIAESLGLEKDSIGIFFDPKSPSRGKVRIRLRSTWPLAHGYEHIRIGHQVPAHQLWSGCWPSLRSRLFDVCMLDNLPLCPPAMAELTLKSPIVAPNHDPRWASGSEPCRRLD